MDRKEVKSTAKEAIKGNLGRLFLMNLVVGTIVGGTMILFSFVWKPLCMISFVFSIIFTYGMQYAYLNIYDLYSCEFIDMYAGMKNFLKVFVLQLLTGLFVFLWSLLLFIPGIVASYRYSFAPYILMDNPEMSPIECIKESKRLTKGYKGQLFVCSLSFIGWMILSSFTFGILYIWLQPYIGATMAGMYRARLEMEDSGYDI